MRDFESRCGRVMPRGTAILLDSSLIMSDLIRLLILIRRGVSRERLAPDIEKSASYQIREHFMIYEYATNSAPLTPSRRQCRARSFAFADDDISAIPGCSASFYFILRWRHMMRARRSCDVPHVFTGHAVRFHALYSSCELSASTLLCQRFRAPSPRQARLYVALGASLTS